MDASHTKALAAIQSFVHLVLTTNSPTPRFLADIVTRATSAQGTYVFTELLQLKQIQSLRSSEEFKGYLTLLEIFSWGTWQEYQAAPSLPQLNEAQRLKLRQLTLLTLSASPTVPLTYPNLISHLSLLSASELETLITSSIYSGLLSARLSPTTTPPMVHVTSVAPLRDLRPLSLGHLLKVLETWEGRCTSVIGDLEAQIEGIKTDATKRKMKENARQEAVEAALKEAKDNSNHNSSAGGAPSDGHGSASIATRNKKGPGFPGRHGPGGARSGRGGNKRDLEDTDDGDENFEDAVEEGGGMDIDEVGATSGLKDPMVTSGGRVAKKRGG